MSDEDTTTSTRPDRDVLRALHRRVVLVFDFDETLASRTTDALVEHLGLDVDEFSREVQAMVDDGWEKRFAEAHRLAHISDSDRGPITADTFRAVAEKLPLYDGVTEMFDRVRAAVHDVADDIDVEFHLVTAGFAEVPQATTIADRFDSIIGGHWHFDEHGAIVTPKSTVGHYDKVRYLKAIAKGIDSVHAGRALDIDADVDETEWHVPYEQMIFVADGDSDLPSFDFMESNAGTAIAVRQTRDPAAWENRGAMREGRRVLTLLPSNYEEGSPLLRALCAAARRAALWITILETAERE